MIKKLYSLIGLAILFVIFFKIDWEKFFVYASRINFFCLLVIASFVLLLLALKTARWKMVLKSQGINYPYGSAFTSYLGGIFSGMITPARLGESVRALYLKKEMHVPFSTGIAGIFMDRLSDIYTLFIFSWAGFLLVPGFRQKFPLVFLFFSVVLAASFLPLIFKGHLEKILRFVYSKLILKIDKDLLGGGMRSFLSSVKKAASFRLFLRLAFISIAIQLMYLGQCMFFAGLLDLNIGFSAVMLFVSLSTVVSLLPISIFGLGTREVTLIFLFAQLGLAKEQALIFSFMIFFSNYICGGIFCYLGWLKKAGIFEEKIHRGFGKGYANFIERFSKLSYILFSGGGDFSGMILDIADIREGDKVLDIGCGVGNMLIDIGKSMNSKNRSCLSVGIDRSGEMIKISAKKMEKHGLKIPLVVSEALSLPFKTASMDVVSIILILHHLPPEMKIGALSEMSRVLKPGGRGILVDLDRPSSLLGWLIAFSRWHVFTIKTNCRYGLEYFFSRAGLRAAGRLKKMGIFSYYLLEKEAAV